MALVRENVTSMYRQIAATLREEMAVGRFEPSGRLPSEADIGSRFAVSRVTVRLALDLLEKEGLIQRRKGKGTFVAGKLVRHELDALRSFHESLRLQDLNASMRLLSVNLVERPPGVALNAAQCLCVRRLHLVDGEPVALGCSYLPAEASSVDWQAADLKPIYSVLEDVTGTAVCRANIEVRAQQAGSEIASILDVRTSAAILVMDRKSYLPDGSLADQSQFFIRSERYSFVLSSHF